MKKKTDENITTGSGKLKGDGIIWAVFFALCIISIVEVFSASSTMTYKTSNYWGPVVKHTVLLGVGWLFMVATINIKCKYFKLVTPLALGFSLLFLGLCYVCGAINEGHRWIPIPGTGLNFQPSEMAKGAVVMATALILSSLQTEHGTDKRAFKWILWISGLFIVLIGLENLSTAALLSLVVIMMMWIGRVPKRQIGKLLGGICIAGVLGISAIMLLGTDKNKEQKKDARMAMVDNDGKKDADKEAAAEASSGVFHRFDTWKSRIDKFLYSEEVAPDEFDLDKEAQVGYSNIAIASSNIVGKGPGNSTARDYLPQAFSDFIYAIIIEEMGIEGAAFVALLYIILLFRTGRIASRCENNFPAFLAMGLALMLVAQALFNMLVAVGLFPVTGQPLPLISKGGTTTIINCVYLGVILSISRTAKKKDTSPTEKTAPAAAAA